MSMHAVWWNYRCALAYQRWCLQFARGIHDVMTTYNADCLRGKR